MRWVWMAAWCVGVAACTPTPFVPETDPPTPAQMRALLDAPVTTRTSLAPLTFHLDAPATVFEGNAMRITCYVPRVDDGQIRIAVEGVKVVGPRPLESLETDVLLDHVPCGSWVVTCATHTRATADSPYTDHLVSQPLRVPGLCDGAGR